MARDSACPGQGQHRGWSLVGCTVPTAALLGAGCCPAGVQSLGGHDTVHSSGLDLLPQSLKIHGPMLTQLVSGSTGGLGSFPPACYHLGDPHPQAQIIYCPPPLP